MATGTPLSRRASCPIPGPGPGMPVAGCLPTYPSRSDELVPLADHVVVLVHHGVPARNAAHALLVGAAVTHRAGLLQQRAVGRLDVLLGRLAFHPVGPLVGLHVRLRSREHGRVVALAVEIGAGIAGQEPVDEFIGPIELRTRNALGDAEARSPGAIAFL